MYYSSICVFSLLIVVNLSLSGADVNRDPLNSNYRMPPYNGPQDEVVNIGNGYRRHNVIILNQNPDSAGSFQRGESNDDILGNSFGSTKHNIPQPNPGQPRQYPGSTVNNIGNGYHNYNTVAVNSGGRTPQTQHRPSNTGNSGGTSFVSPSGTDLFNVGYGIDNHNQILVNGRPLQPSESRNSGGRIPQTQNNARNNGGQKSNSNQVYVNGQPIQPVYNDGRYSTYVLNDQTIHVLNSGSRQTTGRGSQLKRLYALFAQILQIKSQLNLEAARLNIKY